MAGAEQPSPCAGAAAETAAEIDREDKLTKHWRPAFLIELAATSNVTAAALAAGVTPSRIYKLRATDPGFARQWREALLEGYEHLEMELLHRLRFGDPKEGERKFDNATALRLLGQHRETVARERAVRDQEDVTAIRKSIEARLLKLREQAIAQRAAEAEGARGE
jgi:hypothetical protein